MAFHIRKCVVTRKFTSASGMTYLDVKGLTDSDGYNAGDLRLAGEGLVAVPEGEIISLRGIVSGRVFGWGRDARQVLTVIGPVEVKAAD